jgi:hypothetical protein
LEQPARPQVEIAPAIHLRAAAAAWQVDLARSYMRHSSRRHSAARYSTFQLSQTLLYAAECDCYSQGAEFLSAFQVTHGHFFAANALRQRNFFYSQELHSLQYGE